MVNATEGWNWLRRLLRAVPEESAHRQRALLTAGPLGAQIGAYAEGMELLRRGLAMAQQAGDRSAEAWADLWLGRLAVLQEDIASAEEHLQAALALHQELESPLGRVRSLALLGVLRAVIQQRRAEGEEKLRAAADLAHQIEDGWGEGFAHMMLSVSLADAGDAARTLVHGRTALHTPSLGPLLGVPLQQLGRVSVEDDPVRALRLLGSAAGHLERTSTVFPGFVQRRADAARHRAAAEAFEVGRRMSLEEAIAFTTAVPPADAGRNPGGLTPRQLQVAALVAGDLTNREIGRILGVSVRTVESHVDHILAKLGLKSRLELAAWAQGNGLLTDENRLESRA